MATLTDNVDENMDKLKRRKSLRLDNYDYSLPGCYFVTICTQGKQCWFGKVRGEEMVLNEIGKIVVEEWQKIPNYFNNVDIDIYKIMPNHLHGIIVIFESVGAPLVGAQPGTGVGAPLVGAQPGISIACPTDRAGTRPAPTLSDIIGAYKSLVTNEYIKGVKEYGWPAFNGKLFQRSFYDHIIRNDKSLEKIREYIYYNVYKWLLDIENPANKFSDSEIQKHYDNLFK